MVVELHEGGLSWWLEAGEVWGWRGCVPVFFFFYVTIFGLPVTLLEKVHVILQKVPVTKNPNFYP